MIFLATHTHLSERCPANNPDLVKKFQTALSEESAEKHGCKLIKIYVAPTEHIAYIFFETQEHDNLLSFLRPLLKLGETKITPVDEWKHVSNRL